MSDAQTKIVENEIVQKVSVSSCGFDAERLAALVATASEVFLMRVMGKVAGLKDYTDPKTGEVRFGLKGEFLAIDSAGKQYASGVAYLPEGANAQLETQAAALDDGQTVEIGVDIYVIKSTNKSGYSFKCKTYHVGTEDPFAHLRAKGGNMPTISALAALSGETSKK